ncbi:hypothetical protein QJQ45_022010 [Haematococcus lacustris]|nr:hypothetical protein QJQ45_022010 [Haematococcus lacustris]
MLRSTCLSRPQIAKGRKVPICALPTDLAVSEVATGKSVEVDRLTYLRSLPGITAPFNGESLSSIFHQRKKRWRSKVCALHSYNDSVGPAYCPCSDVFDPAGLSNTASIQDIRRWRESEITHGRVAMLAAVGFIVGEQLEDSALFYNFDGQITGPAINHFQQVKQGFWEPLLVAIGLCESYRVSLGWSTPTGNKFNTLKDDYVMGDLGFDPLGLAPTEPEALKDMKTKELNNGRLAMIAIAGFVLQEVAEPGVEIFEHLFYDIEKEVVLELDDIERDLGLPETPIPVLRTRGA